MAKKAVASAFREASGARPVRAVASGRFGVTSAARAVASGKCVQMQIGQAKDRGRSTAMSRSGISPASMACPKARAIATGSPARATAAFKSTASKPRFHRLCRLAGRPDPGTTISGTPGKFPRIEASASAWRNPWPDPIAPPPPGHQHLTPQRAIHTASADRGDGKQLHSDDERRHCSGGAKQLGNGGLQAFMSVGDNELDAAPGQLAQDGARMVTKRMGESAGGGRPPNLPSWT